MKILALVKTAGVCLTVLIGCYTFKTLAQTDIEPATNIDWTTASDQQVLLQAIEQTTPQPASDVPVVAAFYSAQHSPLSSSPWPPLPGNINNLTGWNLGNGVWLLDDLNFDYSAPAVQAGPMMAMDAEAPLPGSGGGGTNILYPSGSSSSFNPGTNLWIAQEAVSSGNFTGILSNTIPGVEYQLLSENTLNSTQWVFQGDPILAITNWAPWSLPYEPTTNFFLNALSFQDDTGSGIPDWWWLKYFGQDTNVDPYADPVGDGWTLFQDYQNGWNPTNWITPPAPQGLTINNFNSANNTASLSWLPSLGPVMGYTVQTSSGTIPLGNVTTYVDNESSIGATYSIQADYAGGPSGWSDSVSVGGDPSPNVAIVPGPQGNLYLVAFGLPSDLSAIQINRNSWGSGDPIGYLFPETGGYSDINNFPNDPLPNGNFQISAAQITNGIYELPPSETTTFFPYQFQIQTIRSNGVSSGWAPAGAPGPGYSTELAKIPFMDARRHLKDNLQFLLRAADDIGPFQIGAEAGSGFFNSSTDHVCADFYSSVSSGQSIPDPLEPFDDNLLYKNFVFDSNNMTNDNGTALPNTGIFYDGFAHIDFNYNGVYPSILYFFSASTFISETNLTVPASVLNINETTWVVPITIDGAGNFYINFPSDGDQNIYGLPFVSAEGAWYQTNTLLTQTFYPGQGSLNGLPYYEAEQPVLQIMNYYFCEPGIDEMPETNDFAATNASPLIIVPVGGEPSFNEGNTPSQIAAYARVSVGNANPGVYGYLGQYFDTAYAVGNNGNITTNTTGFLSPYGKYFATQPGPAALVTMPDIDAGQRGTDIVYCVSLQVDKNHDGSMDTSFNGGDTTSPNSPMEFWVNNGCDAPNTSIGGGLDRDLQVPPNPPNYAPAQFYPLGHISCARDLENFARLWICGMPSLPTNGNYQVTLSWNVVSGNPAINLYNSVETNGGTGYLTDTNIAADQCISTAHAAEPYGGIYFTGPSTAIASITPSSLYTFPTTNFVTGGNQYFLFEGAGIGEGELQMTVYKNGNPIAQTGVWLDLHDIKDFYEQAHITNVLTTFPAMRNNTNASSFVSDHELANNPNETNQLIVFVHGWRMGLFDYQKFSDTMYKRLYWQGYQGRFASLRWHTLSADDFNFFSQVEAFQTYNPSEYIAFRSAEGVSDYFDWLKSRFPNYSIDVTAHSMGNIVMMEALKIQLAKGHKDIDNYVLMQGAVPAECYDANAPGCPSLIAQESDSPTPNTYLTYPGAINNAINGVMVNFFNTNDFALNFWVLNQFTLKPDTTLGYSIFPGLQPYLFATTLITDPREMMPFAARPRSFAVGAQPGVQGVISEGKQVDLAGQFGFGSEYWDHSGEFNRDIQQTGGFYNALLGALFPQQ